MNGYKKMYNKVHVLTEQAASCGGALHQAYINIYIHFLSLSKVSGQLK